VQPNCSRSRRRNSGARRAPPFCTTCSDETSKRVAASLCSQLEISGTTLAMTVTRSRSTLSKTESVSVPEAMTTVAPAEKAPSMPGEARL
jgi:hypothetical protein